MAASQREGETNMKRLLVLVLLTASAACSFGDPCDKCYDADYSYDHPYFCQECLEEKGEED